MAGMFGQQQPGLLGMPSWGLSGAGQITMAPQQQQQQQGAYYGPLGFKPPDWYKPQNYWGQGDGQPLTNPFKVLGTIKWLLGGHPGADGTYERGEQFLGRDEGKK